MHARELILEQAREQAVKQALDRFDPPRRRRAVADVNAKQAERDRAEERQRVALAPVFRRHGWRHAIRRRQTLGAIKAAPRSARRQCSGRSRARARRAPRASRAGPGGSSSDGLGDGDGPGSGSGGRAARHGRIYVGRSR